MAHAQQVSLAGMPPAASLLSGHDALRLLEIIRDCCSATATTDVTDRIFPAIGQLIPFDFGSATVSVRDKTSHCGLKLCGTLEITTPHEFHVEYDRQQLCWQDPIALENYKSYQPQFWSERERLHYRAAEGTWKRLAAGKPMLSLMSDFGMRGGFTVGCGPSAIDEHATFCIFLGPSMRYDDRSLTVVEHLGPHLHQALSRTASPPPEAVEPKPILSARETQVLGWLRDGKSSWDISAILGISERTVNFHVYNIMQKLGAQNRSHAVAVALQAGVLRLE